VAWLSRFLPANICEKVAMFMFTTQQQSRARQGAVSPPMILIARMAPDLSYDNTRSEQLNFSGMK